MSNEYVQLPQFNMDLRDASLPGQYVSVPTGAFHAKFLGANIQATSKGDQYRLNFEIVEFPGAVRSRLLDVNALVAAGNGQTQGLDPDRLRYAKGDLLSMLVSAGYSAQQLQGGVYNANIAQMFAGKTFTIWHTKGDWHKTNNPNGAHNEIQFLAPDVWAERARTAAAAPAGAGDGVTQTAGPSMAQTAVQNPPPTIDARALANAMGQGQGGQQAPGGLPGGLPGFSAGAPGASASGVAVPGGLSSFGAPGVGGQPLPGQIVQGQGQVGGFLPQLPR